MAFSCQQEYTNDSCICDYNFDLIHTWLMIMCIMSVPCMVHERRLQNDIKILFPFSGTNPLLRYCKDALARLVLPNLDHKSTNILKSITCNSHILECPSSATCRRPSSLSSLLIRVILCAPQTPWIRTTVSYSHSPLTRATEVRSDFFGLSECYLILNQYNKTW